MNDCALHVCNTISIMNKDIKRSVQVFVNLWTPTLSHTIGKCNMIMLQLCNCANILLNFEMICWGCVFLVWEYNVSLYVWDCDVQLIDNLVTTYLLVQGSSVTDAWVRYPVMTPMPTDREKAKRLVSLWRAVAAVRRDWLAVLEIEPAGQIVIICPRQNVLLYPVF